MDSKILREASLSYLAIYDQDLREEMEECGMISEERAPGVKPYKPGPTGAEVRADAKAAAQKKAASSAGKSGYGSEDKFKSDWKLRATPSSTSKRKDGSVETVSQRMDREKPYGKRMTGQMAREYGSRHAAEVTRVVKGAGEPQSVTMPRMKSKPSKDIVRKEEADIYDVILSHLIDEGYAETQEAAEAIMVNMSEEWRESICEEYKKLPVQKMSGQIVRKLKIHDPNYYKPGALTQAQKLINVMDTHSERKEKAKSKLNKNK